MVLAFPAVVPVARETGVMPRALVARRGETHRVVEPWLYLDVAEDLKLAELRPFASPRGSSLQLVVILVLECAAPRQVGRAPGGIRMEAGPPETGCADRRDATVAASLIPGEDTAQNAKGSCSRRIALAPSSSEGSLRGEAATEAETTLLGGRLLRREG